MPNTYEMGGGSATLPAGRNFWNPDPNADKALQALSDRYKAVVPGYTPPNNSPGSPTPTTPSTAPGTYGQGGVFNWPEQSGGGGGGEGVPWRGSSANRQSSSYGRSAGVASQTTGPAIPEPTYQGPAAPKMPDYTPRDYAPPGEDKGYEAGKRRELMGAGQRELRQRTQEAIIGARSLSNPAARKDFARAALAGFGEGLEKVSRGATGQAATLARQKRADEMGIYNTKFKLLEGADITNYQNEIKRIATDFATQQRQAQTTFEMQRSAYLNQPQANIAAQTTAGQAPGGTLTAIQRQRQAAGLPVSYARPASNNPTFQYR